MNNASTKMSNHFQMRNPFPNNPDRFNPTGGRLEEGRLTPVQRLLVAEDASTRFEVTIHIQRIVKVQGNRPFMPTQTTTNLLIFNRETIEHHSVIL
jgi:hypothetical protein